MPSTRLASCLRPAGALVLTLLLAACGTLPGPPQDAARPAAPAPTATLPRPMPHVAVVPQRAPIAPRDVPPASDAAPVQTGIASWYGRPFHGRRTASGEVYDMNAMTAAHRTMPLPSHAVVRNPANGREVVVRVNDRGPFKKGRIIDLSRAAARQLGIDGLATVQVRRLSADEVASRAYKAGATTLARNEPAQP
jgi:rare lipoprotein A